MLQEAISVVPYNLKRRCVASSDVPSFLFPVRRNYHMHHTRSLHSSHDRFEVLYVYCHDIGVAFYTLFKAFLTLCFTHKWLGIYLMSALRLFQDYGLPIGS